MSLSISDIIGIVTIIVSCPPLLLLIWKILDWRSRQERAQSNHETQLYPYPATYPAYQPVYQPTLENTHPKLIHQPIQHPSHPIQH
ncbi:hypothetical protein BO71DRAFT_399899 [Aspergillus ellipticus CBS 707.79]|uniref:Uncharacterized protein n=1 Tax=Aspergillus ellipticus CBS 707.79 TaxID=1448320 RepID=A0A319DG43_9EURO|nr:hypothetical protein BO71DRAFT_399899 [Aspergillus ellipticus CBS 707.79]